MEKRNKLKVAVATAAAVALNFAMAGVFVKAVDWLLGPPWTYVLHFLMGLFFGVLVLLMKHAAAYVRTENKPSDPVALARWEKIRRIAAPFLLYYAGWELKQLHLFKNGWRRRLSDYGALPAAIIASLVVGPILAAFTMRLMAVPEKRAWAYVFVAALVTTITMVTGALGVINVTFSALFS